MKMEQIECSETSAYINQTPGNHPKEKKQQQYFASKAEYAATIRKERRTSWKEFCTTTSATNPWNGLYMIAAGRGKQAALTTTLRQQDGTLTTNPHGTLLRMLRNLTPEENEADDNEFHKQIRALTQEAIDTSHDKEFIVQEVNKAVASTGNKKAPWLDGIPSEVFKNPATAHNSHLQRLPQERKFPPRGGKKQ